MAVVYFHRRKDTNEVFYVGIGKTVARSKSKKGRNSYWHNIVNKVGYDIEIIHNKLSWEQACELEIKYIKDFGRKDLGLGILVNMTDGGDGASCGEMNISKKYSVRKKISKSNSGKNNPFYNKKHSNYQKNKWSSERIGKNNR